MKNFDMVKGAVVTQKNFDYLFDDDPEQKPNSEDKVKQLKKKKKGHLFANFVLIYQLANNCQYSE